MTVQVPTVALDTRKVAEIQDSIPKLVAQAQDIEIVDNEDYELSGTMLDLLIVRQKKISEFFDVPAKQADAVHKWITGQRAAVLIPLQQAENLIKRRRVDFRAEQERIRRDKEEEERAKAKAEQEKESLKEAQRLHEMGETEAANTVVEQAAMSAPPAVFVPSSVPKQKGKSIRKVYRHKIVNQSLIKPQFMIPDDSAIKAIVSKLGHDAVGIVGGIEVVEEEIESVRSANVG